VAIAVGDEFAAYKLAQLRFTGVFYQSDRPTKNTLKRSTTDLELLQKTFDRMK